MVNRERMVTFLAEEPFQSVPRPTLHRPKAAADFAIWIATFFCVSFFHYRRKKEGLILLDEAGITNTPTASVTSTAAASAAAPGRKWLML